MQAWWSDFSLGLLGAGIMAIITLIVNFVKGFVKKSHTLIKEDEKKEFLKDITDRLDGLEPMRQAVLSLLRENIKKEIKDCVKDGFATLEDRERISRDYMLYKKMGGNGYLETYMATFDKLPNEN